ncbi:MAG: tripartite tricarboxylate transporter substrate binding protein [Thermodesulfobacteriota bacterium]|nr:tripartite tricarboxylate transporter substrate binding protein [Thermodesulfobacteriota bacterium]
MKAFRQSLCVLVLTFLFLSSSYLVAAAAYPEKPIEFVTHSAPGGGSDIFIRHIIDMMGKEKLLPVSLVPMNKSGGSGAVATAFVGTKKGDPYTIFATTTAIYTTLAKGEVKLNLDDFTPICMLIQDPNILTVRANAPWKNVKEFIAEAKKKRKGVSMGLASIGASDHIAAHRIEKATGVEFNIVSFKQGSEAFGALLGGHVDFGLGNPGEMLGQMEAGKLRALAAVTEKRIPYVPKLPTLKEEGIDVNFFQNRGIWGTKDMPKDVVKYLESAFQKLTQTETWKKYLVNETVMESYMGSADFKKFLEKEMVMFTEEMKALGLVKKN